MRDPQKAAAAAQAQEVTQELGLLDQIVEEGRLARDPASRERGTAGGLPADLVLDVTAKTYRYLDEEEQAAAQPKAAPTRRKKKGEKG